MQLGKYTKKIWDIHKDKLRNTQRQLDETKKGLDSIIHKNSIAQDILADMEGNTVIVLFVIVDNTVTPFCVIHLIYENLCGPFFRGLA